MAETRLQRSSRRSRSRSNSRIHSSSNDHHHSSSNSNDDDGTRERRHGVPRRASTIDTPSVLKILRYTVPAIGIWLCSPVLSMIDTAAVGLLSGTAQQAALSPAVSIVEYGALTVAFMYTAATNLIAAATQEDADGADGDDRRAAATLVTALKLALLVGTGFGALLAASSRALLGLLVGDGALDPVVLAAALRYIRIRALGLPAMVVIGTAQSACLGMQDVRSPLYVLAAAAGVNFLGDCLLVPRAGAWLGGAAGAAWATVFSQYVALAFFGGWLTARVRGGAGGDTPPPKTRGFLADGRLTLRSYLSFSKRHFNRAKAREFLPFVVPVTTTSSECVLSWSTWRRGARGVSRGFDLPRRRGPGPRRGAGGLFVSGPVRVGAPRLARHCLRLRASPQRPLLSAGSSVRLASPQRLPCALRNPCSWKREREGGGD
jgi:hypothetical protein